MGEDRRGWVRTFGLGVTSSDIYGPRASIAEARAAATEARAASRSMLLNPSHLSLNSIDVPLLVIFFFSHFMSTLQFIEYCESWSTQELQRQFIEDLGIPSAWMHEALLNTRRSGGSQLPWKSTVQKLQTGTWAAAGSSVGLEPIFGIGYYFTLYSSMVDTFESGFYPSERGWPKITIGNEPAGQVEPVSKWTQLLVALFRGLLNGQRGRKKHK
ncbi:nuclear pore complex protein NUP96 [Cinnamomum micranthum f. kanehirae]|uniref:Nuclear pore complex protein NUP96 n=1 Tax=Cinnamomum micranthum f. kanehirae TaxID=337451 RepID=A0A3S3NPM2_9MAGN|nr:nuclear pore complex protein NUP96 [Cinnamomum micranthum f. kanehirae]